MALAEREARVARAIEGRRGELIALAAELIGYDTTAGPAGAPAREEAALQGALAERLRAAGAEVDLWEPGPDAVAGSRQVPPGLRFDGRPQLAARFPGADPARARSLLLNGHVDVVSAEPNDAWASHPFRAEVRGANLHGRGACDMKGGVAAIVVAAETLAALGVELAGDLTVCTVTDEEATGAGAIAAVARGVCADAGIVAEPTSFDVWVAVRGDVIPTITVPGRLGHAGVEQPDWRDGGAVNAIHKASYLIEEMRALEARWRERPDHQHPHLSPGHFFPTVIDGGDWVVNVPASCRMTCHVAYLPAHADPDGWGTQVEREVEQWLAEVSSRDPWLAEHPPTIEWSVDIPPAEVPDDAAVVGLALAAGADVGRAGRIAGLDSWHDGATFTRFAGTPTVAFGPRSIDRAHTVDEFVPVDDLVHCAQALAVAAMRHCREA